MRDLDLNLLRTFEALHAERMINRAAARLGLTPSAVSHALTRLRDALEDPLFIRGPQGLQPTARADDLAPVVARALSDLRAALLPGGFDPATSRREFRVAAGAMIAESFLPDVVGALRERAGGCRLSIWGMTRELAGWLDSGMVDLAIGGMEDLSKRFASMPLLDEQLVWVARTNHPMAHRATGIADLIGLSRVSIEAGEQPIDARGVWVEGGIERRGVTDTHVFAGGEVDPAAIPVGASAYDSRSALAIVERTDLIALVPLRLSARIMDRFEVRPMFHFVPVRTATVSMLWHRSQSVDAGHAWLRQLIRSVVAAATADHQSLAPGRP